MICCLLLAQLAHQVIPLISMGYFELSTSVKLFICLVDILIEIFFVLYALQSNLRCQAFIIVECCLLCGLVLLMPGYFAADLLNAFPAVVGNIVQDGVFT